jgi:hypothetical protein
MLFNHKHKKRQYYLAGTLLLLLVLVLLFLWRGHISPPPLETGGMKYLQRERTDTVTYVLGNDWLKYYGGGLWCMYAEGAPYERGYAAGALSRELIADQEEAFVKFIREIIPFPSYLRFLKYFVAWFNRNLPEYIPLEYQQEIYGLSRSASDKFDFVGNGYERLLNYHAAHDIGHALQNLHLVACTSFSVWDDYSADSSLLTGRNFDFYAGDDFAKEKILFFMHPQKGYDFAFVTWGGFEGVVSGMNMEGLTVTINAAPSSITYSAKTPVSIVAREILQYASNIEEAYAIAARSHTFVSETFLISSARDHRSVIIEKSRDTTLLYSEKHPWIIATNHFQSPSLQQIKNKREADMVEVSTYRHQRVQQLLRQERPCDVEKAAAILRDRQGLDDKNIGLTNEKAINQLIAHHSVIFQPEKRRMWLSLYPFQEGEYVCVDLKDAFSESPSPIRFIDSLRIPADTFLFTREFHEIMWYKRFLKTLAHASPGSLGKEALQRFTDANPEYFLTWERLGDYYLSCKNDQKAKVCYTLSLTKELPCEGDKERIEKKLASISDEKQK